MNYNSSKLYNTLKFIIHTKKFVMSEEVRQLAKKHFIYLDKQIKRALEKINGLALEYDDSQIMENYIRICLIQRARLSEEYGFRL